MVKKDFKCELCLKEFSQKTNLKRHMLTHTENNEHHCNISNKKFSQKTSLARHYRIHAGEKLFGCGKCGNWFTQKWTRTRHIYTVHKEFTKKEQRGFEILCIVLDYRLKGT